MTLDRAHFHAQTGGDADLARDLLELLDGQCERLLPIVLTGSADEQAVASHTLKGAALAVGAFRVAHAADVVEARAVAQTNQSVSGECLQELRTAVRDLRLELSRIASGTDTIF